MQTRGNAGTAMMSADDVFDAFRGRFRVSEGSFEGRKGPEKDLKRTRFGPGLDLRHLSQVMQCQTLTSEASQDLETFF